MSHQRNYYDSVQSKALNDFSTSALWTRFGDHLGDIESDFYAITGSNLLARGPVLPDLLRKPFDSFFLKTFRKNVLENHDWPSPPQGEWILPDNWFSRITDIVRTTLIAKYLDGVSFLSVQIETLCNATGWEAETEFQAREEGYYAAHLVLKNEFEIPAPNWDTVRIRMGVEIQIATQVQDVVRQLLHTYYEAQRASTQVEDVKWQWDYRSEKFATNYLSHILHYVDGMVVGIREGQHEKPG